MKKLILILTITLLTTITIFAQTAKSSVEVLYFKANLACCKAKSCNVLEADIKDIIEKSYPTGNVVFKEVKLTDEANKALVEKYNAKSQTVIIVKKKKKKETSTDVSDIVQNYLKDQNKEKLKQDLLTKVDVKVK